ncbi:unnamed protein product [Ixodes persulcatus]
MHAAELRFVRMPYVMQVEPKATRKRKLNWWVSWAKQSKMSSSFHFISVSALTQMFNAQARPWIYLLFFLFM